MLIVEIVLSLISWKKWTIFRNSHLIPLNRNIELEAFSQGIFFFDKEKSVHLMAELGRVEINIIENILLVFKIWNSNLANEDT